MKLKVLSIYGFVMNGDLSFYYFQKTFTVLIIFFFLFKNLFSFTYVYDTKRWQFDLSMQVL